MNTMLTPKNICLVVPTLVGGGAEKVIVNLANEWHAVGYNVMVFTKTHYLPEKGMLSAGIETVDGNGSWLALIWRLRSKLARKQSTYILSTLDAANGAVFLAKIFRLIPRSSVWLSRQAAPIVPREDWNTRSFFLDRLRYFAFKFSDGIVANSISTCNSILKCYSYVDQGKIFVIRNPVFNRDEFEFLIRDTGTPSKNTSYHRIVVVSSLRPVKRIWLAIEAINLLVSRGYKVHLDIYGQGDQYEFLSNLICRLKLNDYIRLMGYKSNILQTLKQYQLLLHPSKYEGFGNVIAEALAAGLQVIADSSSGSPAEILNHGEYGFLVDCSKADDVAEAIVHSLERPMKQEELKGRAMSYLTEGVAEEYFAAFEKAKVN